MYLLPGAQYVDPEFSWKYAVAPSPIGFVNGRGLGPQFEGNLLVGASRTTLLNGFLFRFKFTPDRQHFSFTDSRLADRVADNTDKFDQAESESLVIGRDFGITTYIVTGPNGNVFVVSLSNGAVYEISSKPQELFIATLDGAQEVPANSSNATGGATLLLSPDEKTARVSLTFQGLGSNQTDAHIHGPAPVGVSAPAIFPLPVGQISDFEISLTAAQVQDLRNGLLYINVHSSNFPSGEIRGQFQLQPSISAFALTATNFVVNEGAGSASVAVKRSGNTANAISVAYATVAGSAKQASDYVPSAGTINFAAGETLKNVVVPIVDDTDVEGTESFSVVLSAAAGGPVAGSPFSASITIIDNDAPMLLLEENSSKAVALTSVTMLRDPFSLLDRFNLGADERTRVMLFVSQLELGSSENVSAVTLLVEDSQHRTYSLVVEDVRKVPGLDWLSQVVVRLPDEIDVSGEFWITVSLRGMTSNRASIELHSAANP
jgi:hypothetical protein